MAALISTLAANTAFCEALEAMPPPDRLKQMSLEELMDLEVTLVSKRPEKLSEAASAIQVITREEIRRSGAGTLPEALKLASNIHVAQLDSWQWAISARGFTAPLANKLLVMIDGRTVYTPLHAGVFWDAQHVLMEDIDRIEVVSGPGGTLWGANAVNGVINIITRNAGETQGPLASVGGGTLMRNSAAVRYGGKAGENLHYRVFYQSLNHKSTELPDGKDGNNSWGTVHGGFRMDWSGERSNFTMQAEAFDEDIDFRSSEPTKADGQHVLGRWTHGFSPESQLKIQAFVDRNSRHISNSLSEEIFIYDLDMHHGFQFGSRHALLWGGGYRFVQDAIVNPPVAGFLPARRDIHYYGGFLQDQITLLPDRLKLTLGTKLGYNSFSDLEVQPSGRAAWTPTGKTTVWGAVSRAVRTPSRIDTDIFTLVSPAPGGVEVAGGPDFVSEELVAYEVGYRLQFFDVLAVSLATFYNQYDNLRILEEVSPSTYEFTNGLQGDSRGVEISANYQAVDWWGLRGGYTYLETDFWEKPGHSDYSMARGEGNDPTHRFSLQSMMDLPAGFEFNSAARYVDDLPYPKVPWYFTFDAGVSWRSRDIEISIMGNNLAERRHQEFSSLQRIPRSVQAKATVQL